MRRGDIAVNLHQNVFLMLTVQQAPHLGSLAYGARNHALSGKARVHHKQINAVDIVKNLFQNINWSSRTDGQKALASERLEPVERTLYLIGTFVMNAHNVGRPDAYPL